MGGFWSPPYIWGGKKKSNPNPNQTNRRKGGTMLDLPEDVMMTILQMIPSLIDELIMISLTHMRLYKVIKVMYPVILNGPRATMSSLARFRWIRSQFTENVPLWFRTWDAETITIISGYADIDVLRAVLSKYHDETMITLGASNIAARMGRVDVLELLENWGFPRSVLICEEAAAGGDVQTLQYLESKGGLLNWGTCASAGRFGQLGVLKWLRARKCPWNHYVTNYAAQNGHFELIKWAYENGCPIGDGFCAYASEGGYLPIILWGMQRTEYIDEKEVCSAAAKGGHLHILTWARQAGLSWDARVMWKAAQNNHLHIIQYACAEGCDWNAYTPSAAASQGHLDILIWCIERGCPYDDSVYTYACSNGHLHILKWLYKNDPMQLDWKVYILAQSCNHNHILTWLHNCVDSSWLKRLNKNSKQARGKL